jgi:hypothetical protein
LTDGQKQGLIASHKGVATVSLSVAAAASVGEAALGDGGGGGGRRRSSRRKTEQIFALIANKYPWPTLLRYRPTSRALDQNIEQEPFE